VLSVNFEAEIPALSEGMVLGSIILMGTLVVLASYPVGTGASIAGGKAEGARR
jgi:hypothetical protein